MIKKKSNKNSEMQTPILLFVYARPEHTRLTVEALLKNSSSSLSDLIIFSDAAKTQNKQLYVNAVRRYLKTIKGFKSVTIHYRYKNYGLAKSIIDGVTMTLKDYKSVIVLEDDLITSPYFLKYMNESLRKYANDSRVCSISAYTYNVEGVLPETFFVSLTGSWGWATWQHAWKNFNPDGKYLLNEIKEKNKIYAFNFNGSYNFYDMLKKQILGENDSWAIRWYASSFLANKLILYPGRSLVKNIGFDSSGVHCDNSDKFNAKLTRTPIKLKDIPIQVSQHCNVKIELFFYSLFGWRRFVPVFLKISFKYLLWNFNLHTKK